MSPTDAVYEFMIFGCVSALLVLLVISFPKTVVTPRKFSLCLVSASCLQVVAYNAIVFDGGASQLGILESTGNAFRVITVTLLSLIPATIVWLHTRRVLAAVAGDAAPIAAGGDQPAIHGSEPMVAPGLTRGRSIVVRLTRFRRRTVNRIGLMVSLFATAGIFLVYKTLRVVAHPRRLLRLFS